MRGAHVTKLSADGSGKSHVQRNKFMIGRGSAGFPIRIAPPNDLGGVEGVEDDLSVHQATGLAWAAGSRPAACRRSPTRSRATSSASRSPPIPTPRETLARSLAGCLVARGVEMILQGIALT